MIKVGSTNIANVKIGSTQVTEVYQGASLVWSAVELDPDAEAYLTATGITDPTFTTAINTAIVDLKAASIWTKLKVWHPHYGTSAQQKYNVKNPLDTDAAFRATFTGGSSVFSTSGYQPNVGAATGGYANTHFIPSTNLTLNSEAYFLYSTTNNTPGTSDSIDFGAYTSTSQASYLALKGSAAKNMYLSRLNSGNVQITNTDAKGLYIINKNGDTTHQLFKNGTMVTSATNGGTLTANKVYLGTLNLNGTAYANGYTNQVYAGAGILSGLSVTDITNLTNIIQAFNTALGRNITF